ncbi:MerR family transcriptional regulator [Promicromonospora citrea]|uniref:MerR family transcriptional regulator n=1 Tax=Promicromonospora citrea TaxID=43677 RepID=A0A8H9GN66_9MICO|nr:MerR family transcriptional regulator [Promicromonospora citrea]NNH50832.1 MerR family transcriptional regulator [Promicromonospora citrea]GGM35660.1 MerR family transcriptional regulator [Promicromonospora citrea]
MTSRADGPLRTADVVRATGYSAQQVRDLERLGVLPPAVREPNGYRAYTADHVRALHAYRGLAAAAGPVDARCLLGALVAARDAAAGPSDPTPAQPRGAAADPAPSVLTDALAAVNAVHARFAREREEVLRALAALDAIRGEGPAADEHPDALTITQLAAALGVRTSTLRFWEQEGLVHPERVTTLRARRYGSAAVREARVVAALRAGGYGVPAVREVIRSLDAGAGVDRAREILDDRLRRIATRTLALLRAGSDVAALAAPG